MGQFIFGKVLNKRQTELPRFRQLLSGNTLLTKGIVGLEGDIVVDDIDNPRVLYGVCDGKGTFYSLTKANEQEILNSIRRTT